MRIVSMQKGASVVEIFKRFAAATEGIQKVIKITIKNARNNDDKRLIDVLRSSRPKDTISCTTTISDGSLPAPLTSELDSAPALWSRSPSSLPAKTSVTSVAAWDSRVSSKLQKLNL